MGFVGKVTAGGSTSLVGSTLYGTCSTGASTAAKTVTLAAVDSTGTPMTGLTVHVKFTNGNTAGSPTLKVGSYTAATISKASGPWWAAGAVVSFTFDGTNWVMNDPSPDVEGMFVYKGTKATVADLPSTGNKTGDVWHVTANGGEYAWDGSTWQELGSILDISGYEINLTKSTDTVTEVATWSAGSVPTLGTNLTATYISAWSAGSATTTEDKTASYIANDGWSQGTLPSLTIDATTSPYSVPNVTGVGTLPTLSSDTVSIPNVTGVGSAPSLTKSNVTIPNVTSVGSAPSLTVTPTTVVTSVTANTPTSASVSNGVLTITAGTACSSGTGSVGSASNWSAGSAPTLGTDLTATYISAWSAGSAPTLGTAISAINEITFSQGTLPTLGTAISIPKVSGWSAGTLPSLTHTPVTVKSVKNAGTAPSMTKSDVTIPNVTSVGSAPSLTTSDVTVLTDVSATITPSN